jgi:pilus assembly protein CpaB
MSTARRASSLGTIGFMVAAVVFAALAGVLVSQLLENRYSKEPVRAVVVVKHDVPAGVPFRAKDLAVVDWPQSAVPRGAYTKVKKVADSKRTPLVPLVKGQAVLVSQLSQPNAGIGVASLIEEGKRAVSIKTDDPVTLAQLVYPGARVDVLSTAQRQGKKRGNYMQTRTVLQNVKVLAVGEDIDPLSVASRRKPKKDEDGAFSSGRGSDSKEVQRVITVLVTPQEAEDLSQAEREGKIYIALRNPRDTSIRKLAQVVKRPAEGPPQDWGTTVTKKAEEEPKPKRAKRRRRRRPRVKVASSSSDSVPRIRIFRGGK